jgi:hypothetical protein
VFDGRGDNTKNIECPPLYINCSLSFCTDLKGVRLDFYGIFMILSYSLDDRQVPLHIVFNVDVLLFNCIIYDFFGYRIYPKQRPTLG